MEFDSIQNAKRQFILMDLIKKFIPSVGPNLLEKLPLVYDSDLAAFMEIEPQAVIHSNRDFLKRIHYSWYVQALSECQEPLQEPLLKILEPKVVKKICSLMNLEVPKGEVHPFTKSYLEAILVDSFKLKSKLPICYLPPSPMNHLLKFEKKELIQIINLLPIPQLAKQIRQIVDRNRLMLIYHALDDMQKIYMKKCMQMKIKVLDPMIDIRLWSGTELLLKKKIHRNGLALFNQSLYRQEKDYLFYLARLLDTGRGKYILDNQLEDLSQEKVADSSENLFAATKFLENEQKKS
ncbi:hypothetical protein N9Y92_03765 [Chlamydiales bacterium]|nr:hypothetical protein [Chlamydiales bacterium]